MRSVVVAAAYFGCAKGGLALAFANGSVTAIWPPTGLALAAVLVWGTRMWPAVALGAFLANVTTDAPVGSALGITIGNTLEALCGAYLLRRAGFRWSMERMRDVIALVLLAAGLSTIVSASIGVFSLWLGDSVAGGDIPSTWRVWWLGDMNGDLVVATALLVLASRPHLDRDRARMAEAGALFVALAAVSAVVFSRDSPLVYAVFPLLFWAGLRFRQLGAVIGGLVVSGFAVAFTLSGQGLFAGGSPDENLLSAQTFVGLATVTALLVAAVRTQREHAEEAVGRLSESETRLAEAQHLAHIGSWQWDIRADEVSWSDEMYRIYGLDPKSFDASYEGFLERVHSDDRDDVDAAVRRAFEEGSSFRFRHRIQRPGGEVRTLQATGDLVLDESGQPIMMMGTGQDITDRREIEEKLEHQALHDPLTGLPNRVLFLDRLEQALARARRSRSKVAVLFCDLDDFKVINDSLGHETGDELLVALTPRLRQVVRAPDSVARFGGDEFVVLCEDVAGEADAIRIAERIAAAFALPLAVHGREHFVTVSTGVVTVRGGDASATEVLRDADAALYRAKQGGRGRYEVFDEGMRAHLLKRLRIEGELRRALDEGEFLLFYQPVISLATGDVVSVEALLRWAHPDGQLLEPADFLQTAEESGVIVPIGRWVIEEASRQAAKWQNGSPRGRSVTVSVNVSPRQLAHPELADHVGEALSASGLEPGRFGLEITENALVGDVKASLDAVRKLKDLGIELLLDDFGTGYSSLSHLKRLPVDTLKIDRSFVDGIGREAEDSAIVTAVLTMARALDMSVIAEGVETEDQLAELRERGCEYAQGFYFSRPLRHEALKDLMRRLDAGQAISDARTAVRGMG